MVSSPLVGPANCSGGGGGGGGGGPGRGGCCHVSLKCWCRCGGKHARALLWSSGLAFFVACVALCASMAALYARLAPAGPAARAAAALPPALPGCRPDNEGSWSVGLFLGDSPFSLQPIDSVNMWRDESAAWPVANPVVTCATVSESGSPSNFVADPFLYVQGDTFYLFYETKNSITMQGDIGVAKSTDKGATWQHLGIALDEEWHLSYPYVFEDLGKIYMMPESSEKGELRLYRAVKFPLQWTLERVIMKKPLVDSFITKHNDMYWLFGSDHTGFGTKKNGQLEIWYSSSILGPWRPHGKNPIYNTDKSFGARNGGRPFLYEGRLYRVGQDCGETYGRRVKVFRVETLTKDEYKEVEVPLGLPEPTKGRNAWNGARHHQLDVQRLSDGRWIAVVDGDRVPSGDSVRRLLLGCTWVAVSLLLVALLGLLVGAVKCVVPLNWCTRNSGKRSDELILSWERPYLFSPKLWRFCSRLNRAASWLRGKIKPNSCAGRFVLAAVFVAGVVAMCAGVMFIYGGSGAEEAYPIKGHYSQFTLLTMTYEARLWNLKLYVKHYSRCSSVREIVVVWNKGTPPDVRDFDSAVPVRIRVEERNSLNNRFKVDPLIQTRAVLELDDDIMMTCDDVERGFKVWRQSPGRIVGFYPRLVGGSPLRYRGESHARAHNGYNMILTGAAFIDGKVAFERYWSEEARKGREIVDKDFNCEDVLLNFLYANASAASSSRTVDYVRPAWAIDTSKLSGAAISRNTQEHYRVRSSCLRKFSEMFGNLAARKWEFGGRKDGWDV